MIKIRIMKGERCIIYAPPYSSKSTLVAEMLAKNWNVYDTDYLTIYHYKPLPQDLISWMKSTYDIILTNRHSIEDIDFGFIPAVRLRLNWLKQDKNKADALKRLNLTNDLDFFHALQKLDKPIISMRRIEITEDEIIIFGDQISILDLFSYQ